jgi:hypothetical protein
LCVPLQEATVDQLNDHLAPAFERLDAYTHAKAEQVALSTSSSSSLEGANYSSSTQASDPLLDAYSPKASAHRELQTRLAALAKSLATLKRHTERADFEPPVQIEQQNADFDSVAVAPIDKNFEQV